MTNSRVWLYTHPTSRTHHICMYVCMYVSISGSVYRCTYVAHGKRKRKGTRVKKSAKRRNPREGTSNQVGSAYIPTYLRLGYECMSISLVFLLKPPFSSSFFLSLTPFLFFCSKSCDIKHMCVRYPISVNPSFSYILAR